ncbi:ribosome biogenesis/translation initiation ATPase RLI [archaeon]|jgi:ATP-binding cassette subfamily E protein 1|nr:ribosome biogenesis/translation initiation ATPase RLI [archaeon]MDP6548412.1 ribosome biogenesis/translation initiation ATPase RLI [Candidatus Woesearchaeota archaeon]|tara:strand:- start:23962 stop:25710 length:1749 start_codon:yes stop_codon:yes gene_type:complete
MKRIAVVDNEKLKDMPQKLHIQSLCPVNRSGTECITIEKSGFLKIDEATCIGCGICVKAAPNAIKVVNLPEILDKNPIHRYSENGFALFNLPVPIFGKVVGILGVNGIGKSTAIDILAGMLKPNFGDIGKKSDYKEIIDFFKGTEVQLFFEKVKKGTVKVGYKPQKVDLISKTQKGKVKDLLKKVDEKNRLDEIAKELEIGNILDNEISKISGGELQRVAIAATVLKKANLYIFDEPTSYLDIKQRINVSKFIRDLADDKTSVIVVEHDLIIFDYISDLSHIMFGSEDAYGSVSGLKPTKNSINTYLDGYLKEENIRFRDKKVKFEPRKSFSEKKEESLVSWKNIGKKLGNFTLKTEEGKIHKGEVIGVLGENGIGKTTFVKILANEIKKDEGELNENVKVSYKPQYLESNDELVISVLDEAIKKYTNQIINPLNIKPLLLKKLNEVSGGELQRVAIALCLSKEADLYLLDEPSAYLDVEQRLLISKVIRDFMEIKNASALIVEHDLLFLNYLADKIMVFDGVPAENGIVLGPYPMEDGMNMFLKRLGITLRRDKESLMPRVNKLDSKLDREQKEKGKFYFV